MKISAQSDSLVNCALFHGMVKSGQSTYFPSGVEGFDHFLNSPAILIAMEGIIFIITFGVRVGNIVLDVSRV